MSAAGIVLLALFVVVSALVMGWLWTVPKARRILSGVAEIFRALTWIR